MSEDVTPESTHDSPSEGEAVEATTGPEVEEDAQRAYLATDNQLGQ